MMIVFAKLLIYIYIYKNLYTIFFKFSQKKLRFDDVQGFLFFQTGQGKYSDPKTEEKIFFAARLFFRKSSLIQ